MSRFTEFQNFRHIQSTHKKYVLTADLHWAVGKKGSEWELALPSGTEFDISVPRWLEWALSPHDRRVLPCAAIHDELLNQDYDVYFASGEFHRALIARGVSKPMAWLMYVTTLGWTAFNRR